MKKPIPAWWFRTTTTTAAAAVVARGGGPWFIFWVARENVRVVRPVV